jgi:hypothetical protein
LYRDHSKGREAEVSRKGFSQHRASTVGTGGEIDAGEFEQELLPAHKTHLGGRRRGCGLRSLKKAASFLEFGLSISRCHEAKVADTDKAVGEHMEEEATDELLCREADQPMGPWIVVIPGAEGNGLIIASHKPLVGDGHPVGVMTQVAEDVLRSTEGRFGIDDPFGSSEFSDKPFEDRRVSPVGEFAGEEERVLLEGLTQAIKELAPDHFGQRADRDEEVVLGRYPSVAFEA